MNSLLCDPNPVGRKQMLFSCLTGHSFFQVHDFYSKPGSKKLLLLSISSTTFFFKVSILRTLSMQKTAVFHD